MHPGTKIATCCYCGRRAALILKGATRHELACAGCGAPLHELKMLKTERPRDARPAPLRQHPTAPRDSRAPRRKPLLSRRLLAKVIDRIEDAIEDILD